MKYTIFKYLEQRLDDRYNMSQMKSDILVVGRKSLLPFQKGILISNGSLLGLYNHISERFSMTYVLSYRLNQDVLENFFSQIRAIGRTYDHPTPLEFKYRMKSQIISRNSQILSSGTNVELDRTENLDILTDVDVETEVEKTISVDVFSQFAEDETEIVIVDDDIDFQESLASGSNSSSSYTNNNNNSSTLKDFITDSGLEYVAGYLAYKGQRMGILNLGVLSSDNDSRLSDTTNTWVDYVSNGGLMKPLPLFFDEVRKMDKVFNEYHGETDLKRNRNVNKGLFELMKTQIHLDPRIIGLFIRTRTFIRIRRLNTDIRNKSVQLKSKKSLHKTII